MKANRLFLAGVLAFGSSLALAGGANPPGPGVQLNGSATTTSSVSNTTIGAAVSNMVANAGGASGLANSISSLPGATTSGSTVTSPPINAGGNILTISVNTASGLVTVTDAGGNVIYSNQS